MFKQKYAEAPPTSLTGIELSEVIITESDIDMCQTLKAMVLPAMIHFENNVTITYLKWLDLDNKMWDQPYEIVLTDPSNKAALSIGPSAKKDGKEINIVAL